MLRDLLFLANDLFDEFRMDYDDYWYQMSPRMNVVDLGNDRFRIDLMVAGFDEDEITIEEKDHVLTIMAEPKKEEDGVSYLRRGFRKLPFRKNLSLNNYIEIENAEMKNGILSIYLVRKVPEHMQPKKIKINQLTSQ